MLKQQTMTKENTAIEILVEHIRVMDLTGFPADWELVNNAIDQSIRELSAERERAGKLVEALKVIAEKVGYIWVREDILKLIENYNAHEINS